MASSTQSPSVDDFVAIPNRNGSRRLMKGLWATAAASALAAAVCLFLPGGPDNIENLALAGLLGAFAPFLFPLALHNSLILHKFGDVMLILDGSGRMIGGELRGQVWTRFTGRTPEGVKLRLLAFERYRPANRPFLSDTGRTIRCIHEAEVIVPDAEIERDGKRARIPARFTIPADALPSSLDLIEWKLTCHAKLPGIDFRAHFPIQMK